MRRPLFETLALILIGGSFFFFFECLLFLMRRDYVAAIILMFIGFAVIRVGAELLRVSLVHRE